MKLIGKISLVVLGVLFCISCECPYQDELDRAQYRKSSTGDVFHADVLLGTWQCYYPMIIGGMEFKQIKFMCLLWQYSSVLKKRKQHLLNNRGVFVP